MISKLAILEQEYDPFVRRLNPATVAVLALALWVPAALGQSNGVPASVTSTGFGGSTGPRGVPASVTSTGFVAPGRATPMPPSVTSQGFSRSNSGFTTRPAPSHHEHHDGNHHPRGVGVYAVPYYYPYASDPGEPYAAEDSADDEQYQGGPTIFDRRGPGTSRVAQDRYLDEGHTRNESVAQVEEEPVSNQPDTVLIFKDGHQVEISNYAIVGMTLFDLSQGHHQKILLADLNLTATTKENDDRGIDFQLPAGTQVN
jgi:hypothetical protein